MYSQKTEEAVILDYFNGHPPGRLLDIGAYDGKTFSNTLALIERGWDAVLVEPSAGPFGAMERLHAERTPGQVVMLNVAVAQQDEPVAVRKWWASDDAVATLNHNHWLKWRDRAAFTESEVTTWSVRKLMTTVGVGFDFINIDVEGDSADLWFGEFAGHLVPAMYCIEHDGKAGQIAERGAQMGYRQVYLDGNNIIMVR